MMKSNLSCFFWGLSFCLASTCLSSCSIENEFAEKEIAPLPDEKIEYSSPQAQDFNEKSEQCLLGDTTLAIPLLEQFKTSLPVSGSASVLYQDPNLVIGLEKCLRKTDLENHSSLYLEYVPSPTMCAEIAAVFCAHGKSQECAFWIRRVINQRGAMNGYETAGLVFVKYEKTLSVGSRMLAEAAKLGSQSAAWTLINLSSGNFSN